MTNEERREQLLDMLANPRRLQKGDKLVEFHSPVEAIKALYELDRQDAIAAGSSGLRTTFAKLNRTS